MLRHAGNLLAGWWRSSCDLVGEGIPYQEVHEFTVPTVRRIV